MRIRTLAIGADRPTTLDDIVWQPVAFEDALAATLDSDLVVLDSYEMAPGSTAELANRTPFVAFDDGSGVPTGAALVIRGAVDLHLACLRRAYWGTAPRSVAPVVRRVVVVTGATDPGGHGGTWAVAAQQALPGTDVMLVRGPHATGDPPTGVKIVRGEESLARVLAEADLGVGAAGQTMLEAMACGLPFLAAPLADNQIAQLTALEALGAVRTLGADPAQFIAALAGDHAARSGLSEAARRAVDGQGARRVAERIAALAP